MCHSGARRVGLGRSKFVDNGPLRGVAAIPALRLSRLRSWGVRSSWVPLTLFPQPLHRS